MVRAQGDTGPGRKGGGLGCLLGAQPYGTISDKLHYSNSFSCMGRGKHNRMHACKQPAPASRHAVAPCRGRAGGAMPPCPRRRIVGHRQSARVGVGKGGEVILASCGRAHRPWPLSQRSPKGAALTHLRGGAPAKSPGGEDGLSSEHARAPTLLHPAHLDSPCT